MPGICRNSRPLAPYGRWKTSGSMRIDCHNLQGRLGKPEKLEKVPHPGGAAHIPGVSPADITVLWLYLEQSGKKLRINGCGSFFYG